MARKNFLRQEESKKRNRQTRQKGKLDCQKHLTINEEALEDEAQPTRQAIRNN